MTRLLCPALLLTFLAMTPITYCQEAHTRSADPGLPNAPSTTQATTCTQNNGKPCPECLHKLIGQYPLSSKPPLFHPQRDAEKVHFWTYRSWQDPPLRTNREVFRSKLFLLTHAGAAATMIAACRKRNSREDWDSGVPAVVGMFGMDYIQFRFVGGPNAIGAPIYQIIHYARASGR